MSKEEKAGLLAFCTHCGAPQGTFFDEGELRREIAGKKDANVALNLVFCKTEEYGTYDGKSSRVEKNISFDCLMKKPKKNSKSSSAMRTLVQVQGGIDIPKKE